MFSNDDVVSVTVHPRTAYIIRFFIATVLSFTRKTTLLAVKSHSCPLSSTTVIPPELYAIGSVLTSTINYSITSVPLYSKKITGDIFSEFVIIVLFYFSPSPSTVPMKVMLRPPMK